MKVKVVEMIDLNFVVHSNAMACRKMGRFGLDPVISGPESVSIDYNFFKGVFSMIGFYKPEKLC